MINEITIQSPFDKEEFIKEFSRRRKLDNFKRYKSLRIAIIFTSIFLLLGIMMKADNNNDNFALAIGGISLFFTIILVSSYQKMKRDFFITLHSEALRFKEIQNDSSITISDESIKYQDKEKSMELKWTLFKKYKIDNDIIYLMTSDLYISAYSINKKDCDEETYQELIKLVQSKVS
jgi:hypothetical protein